MAVMAGGDAIRGAGGQDLVRLDLAVLPTFFWIPGLEEPAAAAAAVVVGLVRRHVDEVFLPDHALDNKAKIVGNGIAKRFSNELTGILYSEFYFQILVPVGIDLELSFFYPLGVKLDDALDFKIVGNVEFFESGPDCKEFVPSLGVEPHLASKVVNRLGLYFNNAFP